MANDKIICKCYKVTEKDIKKAIKKGAGSAKDIRKETKADTACRHCTKKFEKTVKDSEKEADVLGEWVKTLPEPFDKEMAELYQEMEAQQTLESRIYKALDKLEALIQHNESDIKTWIPLEYNLQMTYGNEQVKFSDYLTELREQVRADSVRKIEKSVH